MILAGDQARPCGGHQRRPGEEDLVVIKTRSTTVGERTAAEAKVERLDCRRCIYPGQSHLRNIVARIKAPEIGVRVVTVLERSVDKIDDVVGEGVDPGISPVGIAAQAVEDWRRKIGRYVGADLQVVA